MSSQHQLAGHDQDSVDQFYHETATSEFFLEWLVSNQLFEGPPVTELNLQSASDGNEGFLSDSNSDHFVAMDNSSDLRTTADFSVPNSPVPSSGSDTIIESSELISESEDSSDTIIVNSDSEPGNEPSDSKIPSLDNPAELITSDARAKENSADS